jgi:hypothetical protein
MYKSKGQYILEKIYENFETTFYKTKKELELELEEVDV